MTGKHRYRNMCIEVVWNVTSVWLTVCPQPCGCDLIFVLCTRQIGSNVGSAFIHAHVDALFSDRVISDFFSSVAENNVHDMQDAGIAFLEASNCEVYDNTFTNVKYGIRLSLGSSSNNIHDNTFDTVSECTCPSFLSLDT